MKGTLSFNLPEETEEFQNAQNGASYRYSVLQELDNWLRSKLKHEDHPEIISAVYQEVRDKLHGFLQSEDLPL